MTGSRPRVLDLQRLAHQSSCTVYGRDIAYNAGQHRMRRGFGSSMTWMKWLTLTAGLFCLTACADGNIAFGADPTELVGSWSASLGSSAPVQVDLSGDGVLRAHNWPVQLYCDGQADDLNQLTHSPRADLSGAWSSNISATGAYVTLRFDSPECTRGGVGAVVWRDDSGVQICVIVPPDMDPDLAGSDTTLVLRPDAGGDHLTQGCGL